MPDSSRHIFRANSDALRTLDDDIRRMGELARRNLLHAATGLLERNTDLCNRAIADDEEVDLLEKKVDQTGLDIILRFGPVAGDLRRVIASMKVSTALERISDHAVSLAKRGRKINERPESEETAAVRELFEMADAELRDSVESFVEGRLDLALRIQAHDNNLDEAHRAFTARVISRLEQEGAPVDNLIDLLFATRFLERIGDQSVNIAEDTVYLLTAMDVRHGGEWPVENS